LWQQTEALRLFLGSGRAVFDKVPPRARVPALLNRRVLG
jgi:hypothetical protein